MNKINISKKEVTLSKFVNIMYLYKIRMIFKKLLSNTIKKFNRPTLNNLDQNLASFIFQKNFNSTIDNSQFKYMDDMVKENQPQFKRMESITNLDYAEIPYKNKTKLFLQKLDFLVQNLINRKKVDKKINALDKVQDYAYSQTVNKQGMLLLVSIVRDKKHTVLLDMFYYLKLNQKFLKEQNKLETKLKNVSQIVQKLRIRNSLFLMMKFLSTRNLLKKIYRPIPIDFEETCLTVLNDYDRKPKIIFSLVKNNVNYIKLLTFIKFTDNFVNKKNQIQSKNIFDFMKQKIKNYKQYYVLAKNLKNLFNQKEKSYKRQFFMNLQRNFIQDKKKLIQVNDLVRKIQKIEQRKKRQIFSSWKLHRNEIKMQVSKQNIIFQKNKLNGSRMLFFTLSNLVRNKFKTVMLKLSLFKIRKKQYKVVHTRIGKLLKRPRDLSATLMNNSRGLNFQQYPILNINQSKKSFYSNLKRIKCIKLKLTKNTLRKFSSLQSFQFLFKKEQWSIKKDIKKYNACIVNRKLFDTHKEKETKKKQFHIKSKKIKIKKNS